mmetsp:Transcript_14895/g.35352  ORF Transcript_14895/g.35352 Transcript_14895/m.35352 type:complete len:603 (+) Transcript_14895:429-2237(+)
MTELVTTTRVRSRQGAGQLCESDEEDAAAADMGEAGDGGRDRWGSQFVFVLASIGSAIGFGNVWRFPMLCFEYGGGAFLVPYCLALLFTAIPMVVLEFALGQLTQRGHVALCQHVRPGAAGFGWASVLGTFLIAQYYNALLAYCLVYLCASVLNPLPWTRKGASAYFAQVAQETEGPENGGGLVPGLTLGYALVWLLCYLGVRGGAKGIGWLVQLLMPAPFFVLLALLVRAVTLEGAADGVRALLTPDWSVFGERPDIWIAAVSQIFFGVSAGLGTLTTYGSYNGRSMKVVSSAVIVSFSNSLFSLLSALVVFAFLGNMAHVQNKPIEQVVKGGTALAFEVFPTAVSLMPLSNLWAAGFFLMLFNLGLSSAVSMTAPITASLLEYLESAPEGLLLASEQMRARLPLLVPLLVHLLGFLTGLIYVSRAGLHWISLADHFVPMFLTILTALGECVLLARKYGIVRLLAELAEATGERILVRPLGVLWGWLIPIVLSVLFFAQLYAEGARPFGGYPTWFVAIGWLAGVGPMTLALAVPALAAARRRMCPPSPGGKRLARTGSGAWGQGTRPKPTTGEGTRSQRKDSPLPAARADGAAGVTRVIGV